MIEAKGEGAIKVKAAVLGSVLVMLVALLLAAGGSAFAALPNPPFTVNSTGDQADADLGDPVCDAILGVPGRQCTLRAAIQEANATPRADTIQFNIPGTGVRTISPNSELPAITQPVTIDGYTQPGTSPNTLATGTNALLRIELDGTDAGNANGLFLAGTAVGSGSSGSVVKGLVVNRFERTGIQITSDGNRIEGNFVGTDPSGTVDRGNAFSGVGTSAGSGNSVGGTLPEARNLISGNGFSGVGLGCCGGHRAQGNLIGTKKDGTTALGNTGAGIRLSDGSHLVGGTVAGAANTIAFNGTDGVDVGGGDENAGNRILGNAIFSNLGLGIDLAGGTESAAGATANDPQDPDTGPNTLQNKPVVASVAASGTSTTVKGNLNSAPNRTFTLQLFSNPSGNEGRTFLAQRAVTTSANGNAPFTFSLSTSVPTGHFVTATATGAGNTSEFSAPREVVSGG